MDDTQLNVARKIFEHHEEITKVMVVAIGGDIKTGKSLLMNLIITYLKNASTNPEGSREGWMSSTEDIRHFTVYTDRSKHTSAFKFWNESFILHNKHGKVLVLLLDAPGFNDRDRVDTTLEYDAKLASIGIHCSTVYLLNVCENFPNFDNSPLKHACEHLADLETTGKNLLVISQQAADKHQGSTTMDLTYPCMQTVFGGEPPRGQYISAVNDESKIYDLNETSEAVTAALLSGVEYDKKFLEDVHALCVQLFESPNTENYCVSREQALRNLTGDRFGYQTERPLPTPAERVVIASSIVREKIDALKKKTCDRLYSFPQWILYSDRCYDKLVGEIERESRNNWDKLIGENGSGDDRKAVKDFLSEEKESFFKHEFKDKTGEAKGMRDKWRISSFSMATIVVAAGACYILANKLSARSSSGRK